MFGLIALLAIVVVIIIATSAGSGAPEPNSGDTGMPENVAAETEQQRLDFIKQFGWTVGSAQPEVMALYIPHNFDSVLTKYNAIQKRQGFDLEKYKGEKVDRYSYVITNYPAAVTEVYINLIVYKGKVIGGDVCSKELGGFMHGFSPERVTLGTVTDTAVSATGQAAGTFSEPDFSLVDGKAWPRG